MAINSHLKFEIHVVMNVSAEIANALSKYHLVESNALALKGAGRGNSHWLIARYAQNTLRVSEPTHFSFAPGARAIYPSA